MNRDRDLLSEWMDAYGQGIWSYALSMTKDASVADDLAQEVFIQAYKFMDQFRQDSSVKTWLFAIAKNKCADYFRSAVVRKVSVSDGIDGISEHSVEDDVIDTMQKNAVWDAVFQLKRDAREVVVLHIKEEMTFRQVGELMGLTESAARVKYHRAVRQLKEMLGKEAISGGVWGKA